MKTVSLLLPFAALAALALVAAQPPAGRGAKQAATPAARKSPTPGSYKDLRFPDPKPFAMPRFETIALPDGMQVLLREDHELPLINGVVMVRTGTAYDPSEKIGLATLTGQVLLAGGSVAKPNEELGRRFQDLGAELDGSVTENSLSISFSVLKENAPRALDAIKETITAPTFDQEKIDYIRTRERAAIGHRNDDGATVLQREFLKAIFGAASRYAAPAEYATLDRINRADLVNFHRRYFFPKNVLLSLSGDFDSAAMKTRLQALFDDWKAEQPPVPDPPKVSTEGKPGRYLAVKKDTRQAYISMGRLAGDLPDKDYAALEVVAEILGGGSRGRLYQRMHAMIDPLSVSWLPGAGHPGLFRISGTINPFVVTKVLQTINEELNNLRLSELPDAELKTARDAAVNGYIFTFQNQLAIMPRLTQYAFLGMPKDYIPQHQAALQAVTRADILRVAKALLDPAAMTTVVVGNPTGFESPLDSLGAVTPVDLTIPEPRLEAEAGDANSQRLGKELLARAQQAAGGAEKLAAITDYVQEMHYKLETNSGSVEVPSTERWVAPNFIRQDNSLPSGKVSAYSDGKSGWVSNGTTSSLLAGVQLRQMQSDLFRVYFPILLSDRVTGRKINALDENTLEISDGSGLLVKLVLDSDRLVKNMLYQATTADGQMSVIDTYSDYRDVNGVKVPYKVVITVNGQKYQEILVSSIHLNTGLKIQELEKRP